MCGLSSNDGKIDFKVMAEGDLPLLFAWVNQPAVAQWWADVGLDLSTFQRRYLDKFAGGFEFPFMVLVDKNPIGYIEYYVANRIGGGWWPDQPDGVYGIDVFIGDSEKLGKGYGSLFIRLFIDSLFVKPEIKKIIIDPAIDNHRAIRCYQKVGFQPVGVRVTPLGQVMLMDMACPASLGQEGATCDSLEYAVLLH